MARDGFRRAETLRKAATDAALKACGDVHTLYTSSHITSLHITSSHITSLCITSCPMKLVHAQVSCIVHCTGMQWQGWACVAGPGSPDTGRQARQWLPVGTAPSRAPGLWRRFGGDSRLREERMAQGERCRGGVAWPCSAVLAGRRRCTARCQCGTGSPEGSHGDTGGWLQIEQSR